MDRINQDNYSSVYSGSDSNNMVYYVSVPNNLNNFLRFFIMFKSEDELKNSDEVIKNMSKVNRDIDDANYSEILIFSELNAKNIEDTSKYVNELDRIKGIVNDVYNTLLRNGLGKDLFVRKIEVIVSNELHRKFLNWVNLQNDEKFHLINMPALGKTFESSVIDDLFLSERKAIFVDNESNDVSDKPLNNDNLNNSGMVKWFGIVFILLFSLVIGVVISVFLLK